MSTIPNMLMEVEMATHLQLAFDFASELSKQLITLSTGILTLTIALTKNLVKDSDEIGRNILRSCWVLYLLSIICGIWHLMALTGSLAPLNGGPMPTSIEDNARIPAFIQILTFTTATLLIIVYGWRSLSHFSKRPEEG